MNTQNVEAQSAATRSPGTGQWDGNSGRNGVPALSTTEFQAAHFLGTVTGNAGRGREQTLSPINTCFAEPPRNLC